VKRRGPRFGLQWRVTAALVVIVLIPFALSYVLLDQIGRSAANYKANEARESIAAMDKALDAYRDLFETTKRLHADIAQDRGQLSPDGIRRDFPVALHAD